MQSATLYCVSVSRYETPDVTSISFIQDQQVKNVSRHRESDTNAFLLPLITVDFKSHKRAHGFEVRQIWIQSLPPIFQIIAIHGWLNAEGQLPVQWPCARWVTAENRPDATCVGFHAVKYCTA